MDATSDAGDCDVRARQRTWVIGGALLLMSALLVVLRMLLFRAGIIGSMPDWTYYVKDWLWAIGVLILVIGLGRAGSITGRRPISTLVVILQVFVAAPVAATWLSTLVLDDPQNPYAQEDSWSAIFLPYFLVVGVLTLLAATLIGRARAVPSPWSWAPLWAVGATFAFYAATFTAAPAFGGFTVVYLPVISTALLGVLAIVLGIRARTRRPVPVSDA
ncbi:hypothetical protein JF550_00810 [Microbacterium esteraromaticum]|uniref:Uncharacterized protein n=1 Tax=Microbacterium esteraromaticum TaxID=57043 RepID=A0A939DT29_9MICO|nr:hypothetical protein [Microbacterium esteraromaticum]MBN8204492.1 hypothetical protein [Microbacterium esteraromaticum]MBN8414646.1 hypothetical protein [Microbacterium esteraromaticum]